MGCLIVHACLAAQCTCVMSFRNETEGFLMEECDTDTTLLPQNLLEVVTKASEHAINSMDFVDDVEREVVLEKFNATTRVLPPPYEAATIHGLFEHWATETPNARAISFEVSILGLLWRV